MKDENLRAVEGDKVRVWFNGHVIQDMIEGTVHYTPCATGDSWIIIQDSGIITHVQQFEAIEVIGRKVAQEALQKGIAL